MDSIEKLVKRYKDSDRLPDYLAARIKSKVNSVNSLYGINLDPTILSLENNPSLYNQREDLPAIKSFFHRPIDLWMDAAGEDDIVFSKKDNTWITAARTPYRIAIDNPYNDQVESWSRLVSLSKSRRDHFQNSSNPNKSKFLGNLKFIKPLEFATFNKGLGLLVSGNTMRLYAKFSKEIGKSKANRFLQYVCLECKRVRRREDTKSANPELVHGFKIEVHGYPVSQGDITKDFKGTSLTHSNVPSVE